MTRRIFFALFPGCELLDLAGPAQAFFEANDHGAQYELQYCALTASVRTAQGLEAASLIPLPEVTPADWVIVPGYTIQTMQPPRALIEWLQYAATAGARICSVCTGAFLLGQAGLLDGRACTTHWKRIHELRTRFPRARVLDDRLYVEDGTLITSAGIASGIDMTIHLLEQDAGAALAAQVAREMVVYMRRDGSQSQTSIYLEYQDHLNAGVHQIQQHLINEPTSNATLEELASLAHISPRHLSRTFRRATGVSIGEYRLRLRLESARTLMSQSTLKMEDIAAKCGFADARQLRRLWSKHFGSSPSMFRNQGKP
jgi:transcriptional regulator GlxA family with amidase domain